ncbi:retinal G protein coupled receptor b [Clupea harengus]|uniref:RPE-retinal G protein-coupled receptor n=1 Tax=Clupea harengus TaxID=7950 RepID=A0A6P3W3V1_CLUHA|nr:retinal G protein coupled receptor b [Clupea harengus]
MAAYTLPEGFNDFDMFAFGTALLVEGLLGFFLNSIAALSFLLVREQRTPSNFLVFNLNIADLMLNVNGLIAAYASYMRVWPFGQEGCINHGFEGLISIYAAITLIALISWDKYHYYCTNQPLFWATSGTMCVMVWVFAIFWASFPLPSFGWGEFDFEPMKTCCTLDYTKGDRNYITYMLTISVFYFVFPMMMMQSSYSTIYAYFKKTHKYRFNTTIPVRTLLLTWGPYVAMCMYACVENAKLVSPKLRMVLPVLAKTSPIFNAILYSFGNEAYRGGIWRFLTGQKVVDKRK